MILNRELIRILQADLGKSFDPYKALDFLRTLRPENKNLPEAKKLEDLLKNPPEEDTTLQIIYETPFVRGEIVAAGKKTQREHPMTKYLPVHFKKTYLKKASRWETSPLHEETMSKIVWQHFQESGEKGKVPLPLGSTPSTFRSELLEAKSLGASSPIHNCDKPSTLAEQILQAKKTFGPILPLWQGLESLHNTLQILHAGGILHNDAHRENLLLAKKDNQFTGCLIDFETAEENEKFGTPFWQEACKEDKRQLVEEAALISLCAQPNEKLPKTQLAKEVELAFQSSPKLAAVKNILKKEKNTQKNIPNL